MRMLVSWVCVSFTFEMVSVTTTEAATVVELCTVVVGALEELLDEADVELAWLVDPAVDDCVDVLCPAVEVGALEELLDGADVEVAWLVDPAVDDCVAVCVDELCSSVELGALELLDGPEVEVA